MLRRTPEPVGRPQRIFFAPASAVDRLTRATATTIFALLFALLFAQIVSRLLFNAPLGWITELATYMLVASVWISAGVFTRMDAHIRIEFLYGKLDRLSPLLKRVVDGLIDMGTLFFLVVVTLSAIQLGVQNRDAISPALHIPIALLYALIAVSATIMAYFLLEVVGSRRHRSE